MARRASDSASAGALRSSCTYERFAQSARSSGARASAWQRTERASCRSFLPMASFARFFSSDTLISAFLAPFWWPQFT
eukprot:scaffold30707_cov129-Isochrysis_galbana.AAC.3